MRLRRDGSWHVSPQQVAKASFERGYKGCREAGNGSDWDHRRSRARIAGRLSKYIFQTQTTQVQQLTADVVLLDHTLAQYGPETDSVRNLLRRAAASMADRIWRENGSPSGKVAQFEASAAALSVYDEILKLSPRNETERSLQTRAIGTLQELGKTRLLLFAEAGAAIPTPFLVVLIFWLAILFASFGLFADNNATTVVALCIFALSASAAIFLILELGQPFTGLMRISGEPLRNALAPLPERGPCFMSPMGIRYLDQPAAGPAMSANTQKRKAKTEYWYLPR